MKTKVLFFAGLFLLIVAGLATLHSNYNTHNIGQIKVPTTQDLNQKNQQNDQKSVKKSISKYDFEQTLAREAIKVGQIDQNPAHTQRELERWAQVLSVDQMNILKQKVINTDISGDERSLSIYLLSLSTDESVLPILKDIVTTPLPSTNNDRVITFEESIRAQALEGIINNPHHNLAKQDLKDIVGTQSSAFLSDRTQRGLAYLEGKAESPSSYESKMMHKILKKTR